MTTHTWHCGGGAGGAASAAAHRHRHLHTPPPALWILNFLRGSHTLPPPPAGVQVGTARAQHTPLHHQRTQRGWHSVWGLRRQSQPARDSWRGEHEQPNTHPLPACLSHSPVLCEDAPHKGVIPTHVSCSTVRCWCVLLLPVCCSPSSLSNSPAILRLRAQQQSRKHHTTTLT